MTWATGAHEFLHSLFDANVLYPAPIRDILMQLARHGPFPRQILPSPLLNISKF
jgi:hypothetical protein